MPLASLQQFAERFRAIRLWPRRRHVAQGQTSGRAHAVRVVVTAALVAALAGCGSTRNSDSARTATEQMLMSSAIDKAVNEINLQPLSGKEVYLDADRLNGLIDQNYVVSTLRQAMFANGVILKPDRASAKYIVEARAGVLGTNSSSVMIGIPATSLPSMGAAVPGMPSAIPEISMAKTTRQAGVAKISLFAYNQLTGKPIWQSGSVPVASDAKNTWFFGAGPFRRGSIYGEGKLNGGEKGMVPFREEGMAGSARSAIPVTSEAVFDEPPEEMASRLDAQDNKPVANAPSSLTPAPNAAAAAAKPAPTPPPPLPPVPPPPPSVSSDQSAPATGASGLLNVLAPADRLLGTKTK